MVLRKRAPPHLHNLSQGNARFASRSLISRSSPTSFSVSSPSPKYLTRPSRAQSSPHPRRIPSQESIFSPDLNTSPAFDLMSLEQAQRSPIRTSSTDTPNPWADELVENPSQSPRDNVDHTHQPVMNNAIREGDAADNRRGDRVPSIVLAGTQRRMAANESQPNQGGADTSDWEYLSPEHVQLQSNNPFLKASQQDSNAWKDRDSRASSGERDDASGRLGQDEGYIPMTARLSLFDQQIDAESPWVNEPSSQRSQGIGMSSQQTGVTTMEPPGPQAPFDGGENARLQSLQKPLPPQPRASTPGTVSTATTGSSHVLIDFDDPPNLELGRDLRTATAPPAGASALHNVQSDGATSLWESDHAAESATYPPSQSAPISDEETKQQADKRSETYSIRHISWKDTTGTLRESPMLIQNKNGPCPLLALVNALVLRAAGQSSHPPIVRALRTREQISLGLLIEALFDELTTRLGPDDELPDIEALSRFLTMLHTGMNVNPRLTLESNDMPGTFRQTEDIKFYSTFGVPLVHGWIAPPSTDASSALERIGQYHEDIQLLPFRKQELEDRVFQGAALSTEEERVMGDIHAIQQFADVDNATQLSTFGLDQLSKTLQPGSFSILFRNDHFSTIYKHPLLQTLFTLVTDAGYSNHAEVVWESLVDVTGSNAGFYAGDFRVVSHHTPQSSDPAGPRTSSRDAPRHTASSLSAQEQADADYAYALSLQYQEEEQRQPAATHGRSQSAANLGTGTSSSTAERSSRQRQSYANHSQPHIRPTHHDDDAPPPSYEQAAKSPAYSPPQRSPNVLDAPPRSPYPRNQNQYGRYPERTRDRNKDCIVM
ncbi:Putative DUF455 domain protein (AFU_orthologue; AFUA_5G01840) [Aspergillus calidoustus]|uniref:Putative DUF455 domain protein (AFU_orthologue AFUA_5G01840) n=1 Tax=Aspergillus calidoustus TaxID=454130 RepID=A0A0U5GP67_ASPCI|nr:Putative DUF455 domain protein (AFU_orthologue; AFUA_5G01840) [Aspergillus calidoustus]